MNETASAPSASAGAARPRQNPTVNNWLIKRMQHIHTVLATTAGLSGVLAAAGLHFWYRPVSATALWVFLAFFLLVGMGLTIGYHRLFTHRSYLAPTALRVVLAILGSMAAQGPVVFWTALHRMHHQLADKDGDPHSPNLHGARWWQKVRGLWHAYIGWTVQHEVPNANFYARDLLSEPSTMWVNKRYYLWIALGLVLPAMLGGVLSGSVYGALEGFLWGGLIRMFALHNMIWWITSFAHVFGSRDYVSRDLSTNNFWLAIPTLGESWHNHHHAFPRAAILSFAWWQIDISGSVIAILERVGVVSEVCRISEEERRAKRRAA